MGRVFAAQIEQAMALHRQGRLGEATAVYRALLACEPSRFEPHYYLALAEYQRGNAAEAYRSISRGLELKPRSLEALALLAGVLLALDRPSEALDACDRLLALVPTDLDAACNRAVILARLDRIDEAIAQYDAVLAGKPDLVSAFFARGTLLARRARYGEALADFDRVLALAPGHLDSLKNRGNVLLKMGRPADALASYDRILSVRPQDVDALSNRGAALKALRRESEALASYEKALAASPDHVNTLFNCANLLFDTGRIDAALGLYDRVLGLAKDDLEALAARGNALVQLDRLAEAEECYRYGLAIAGENFGLLLGWGNLLVRLGRIDEAMAVYGGLSEAASGDPVLLAKCAAFFASMKRYPEALREFRRLLDLSPDDASAWRGVADCLMETCDWEPLDEVRRTLVARIESGHKLDPLLSIRLIDDPALQLACARRYAPDAFPGPTPLRGPLTGSGERNIRIAYLSPDLRSHPVAFLVAELFELHDRDRFDFIAVSCGPDDKSELRQRIIQAFDQFHNARVLTDEEIATLLRRLEVDIVIDLAGYTEFARPGVLARRAAPIQVSYLGYCGTSGAPNIDYLIADRIAVPSAYERFFSEKIVHLPHSFIVCDSKQAIAGGDLSRGAHGLPDGAFVFCCFNKAYKLTAPVFDAWMRLLRAVEGSVLWLSANNDAACQSLRRQAQQRGIDPERLVFAPRLERREDHFARHRLADLFLDTLPYNAHTTGCDALFSGLPVVTCLGSSFAGRVGASMLHAVGLAELVAKDLDEYEELALGLAKDPWRLATLRRRLQDGHAEYPLFDTDRTRRSLETAYATMYDIWRRGDAPRGFSVEPRAPGQ